MTEHDGIQNETCAMMILLFIAILALAGLALFLFSHPDFDPTVLDATATFGASEFHAQLTAIAGGAP